MQVERNLASGAKNLFMAHTLVAEQVLTPLQPQSVAMLLLMSLSAVDCCCYCFLSSVLQCLQFACPQQSVASEHSHTMPSHHIITPSLSEVPQRPRAWFIQLAICMCVSSRYP